MFLKKFRLHRNGSIRLRYYNYAQNGYYFVTICSKYRINIFGEIVRGKMKYNDLGLVSKKYWQQIPKHFPFVKLDEFVIMPDHVHGIIVIDKQNMNTDVLDTCHDYSYEYNDARFVGARHGVRLQQRNRFGKINNGSLSVIINQYKGAITKWAHKNNIPFSWQPRYYEHVIQNEQALNNVRAYIGNNPRMWHN